MKNATDSAYEKWLILFIDFLGLKEVVEGTVDDADVLHRLFCIQPSRNPRENSLHQSQRLTQFSASVGISF